MQAIHIAQAATKTLWRNKSLWLFGFFIAAVGGTSSTGTHGGGGGSGGHAGGLFSGHEALPSWMWPLLAVGLVVAVGLLLMHVVSEGALIDGVRRSRAGEEVRIRIGFRAGLAHFWVLLGIKALLAVVLLFVVAAMAAPAVLAALDFVPMLTALVSIPLVIAGAPVLLTVYLLSTYALRIAVLDDEGIVESFRAARAFLSGRLLDSLRLLVVTLLGQFGAGLLMVVVVLPAAVVGVVLYFVAGLVPAAIVAGVLALPFVAVLVGAMGTFQSTVWTIGFLEGRKAEIA